MDGWKYGWMYKWIDGFGHAVEDYNNIVKVVTFVIILLFAVNSTA